MAFYFRSYLCVWKSWHITARMNIKGLKTVKPFFPQRYYSSYPWLDWIHHWGTNLRGQAAAQQAGVYHSGWNLFKIISMLFEVLLLILGGGGCLSFFRFTHLLMSCPPCLDWWSQLLERAWQGRITQMYPTNWYVKAPSEKQRWISNAPLSLLSQTLEAQNTPEAALKQGVISGTLVLGLEQKCLHRCCGALWVTFTRFSAARNVCAVGYAVTAEDVRCINCSFLY